MSSRRRLLRAGGAAMTTILTASAGCLSVLQGGNGEGQSTTTGAGTATNTATGTTANDGGGGGPGSLGTRDGPAAYRRWFPSPNDLGADHYEGSVVRVRAFRANRDRIRDSVLDSLFSGPGVVNVLGVANDRIDRSISVGTSLATIVEGTFRAGPVTENLSAKGYEKRGTRAGLDLYAGGDEPPAVGVTDGTAVIAESGRPPGSGPTGLGRIELLADAATDQTLQYHEARPDFAMLTERLGHQTVGAAVTSERVSREEAGAASFAGQVGRAIGFAIDGATTRLTVFFLFDNEDNAAPDAVRSWAESAGGTLSRYRNLSVTADGRFVRLTGEIPTEQARFGMASGGNAGGSGAPTSAWDFEYDEAAGTVTITHAGGDTVDAAALTVTVAGTAAAAQFADEYDGVAAGDSVSIDVSDASAGAQIRVVWSSGDRDVTIALFELPR